VIVFEHPQWLWALAGLPVLALLEWRAVRRADGALRTLVGRREPHPLLAQRRPGSRRIGIALRLTALALLVLGASGPEWGRELVRRSASGSDVLLMIDVSASMDVRDVAPSRLDEARREALAILDRLEGSRVAVVAFAGDAVRLCPLTQDLSAVRLTLESLSSATVSTPGTDLGKALRMAAKVLPPGRREEQAMVLWTDGEDLEHGAREASDVLVASGVRVFAVGVGTPAGDVVPVLDDGGRITDIKRDESGAAVRSRLDESVLRALARRTRGGYFSAARPGGELPRLIGALGTLAHSSRGERLVERPIARFPLCAGLAALLLILQLARARRRVDPSSVGGSAAATTRPVARTKPAGASARARPASPAHGGKSGGAAKSPAPARPRAPVGARAGAAALLAAAFALLGGGVAHGQSAWAKADRAYREHQFARAESLYALRAGQDPPAALRFNHATAALRAGRTEAGEKELAGLLSLRDRAGAGARYNLGTSLGARDLIDSALTTLRGALEQSPDDEDARWNYEVLLRRRQEQERQKQQPRPSPRQQQQQQQQQQPQPQPNQPQSPSPPSSGGEQSPQAPPQSGQSNSPPPPRGSDGMTRQQAEQLLGALQDLARVEEQRQRRVRVMRERRGRDW